MHHEAIIIGGSFARLPLAISQVVERPPLKPCATPEHQIALCISDLVTCDVGS